MKQSYDKRTIYIPHNHKYYSSILDQLRKIYLKHNLKVILDCSKPKVKKALEK